MNSRATRLQEAASFAAGVSIGASIVTPVFAATADFPADWQPFLLIGSVILLAIALTLKALGTGLAMGVKWREMEVRRQPGEAPTMVLSGRGRASARDKGAHHVLLSLTHDGDYALAQAVLVGGPRDDAA